MGCPPAKFPMFSGMRSRRHSYMWRLGGHFRGSVAGPQIRQTCGTTSHYCDPTILTNLFTCTQMRLRAAIPTVMATRKSKIHSENRSSKQRSSPAHEGRLRAAEPLDDMLVARQPLVGMLQQDIEQLLGATFTAEPGGMPPLTLEGAQRPQHWATRGMRHFLNE